MMNIIPFNSNVLSSNNYIPLLLTPLLLGGGEIGVGCTGPRRLGRSMKVAYSSFSGH